MRSVPLSLIAIVSDGVLAVLDLFLLELLNQRFDCEHLDDENRDIHHYMSKTKHESSLDELPRARSGLLLNSLQSKFTLEECQQ